jgi:hypothetical protein
MTMEQSRYKSSPHAGWRGRVFAWFLEKAGRRHDSLLGDRKR